MTILYRLAVYIGMQAQRATELLHQARAEDTKNQKHKKKKKNTKTISKIGRRAPGPCQIFQKLLADHFGIYFVGGRVFENH